MNWTQDQVKSACHIYGPQIKLAGIVDSYGYPLDGGKLLWAESGQESSFGSNCGPRFEPVYWSGAESKEQAQLLLNEAFGRAAAMSYGPWQVMYDNCALLGTPNQIDASLDLSAQSAVNFINNYVIRVKKAVSLQEIARIYNSGNKTRPMTMGVMRYIENVSNYYANAPKELEAA